MIAIRESCHALKLVSRQVQAVVCLKRRREFGQILLRLPMDFWKASFLDWVDWPFPVSHALRSEFYDNRYIRTFSIEASSF